MVTRPPGADGRLLLVVNAARKAVDFDLLRAKLPADVRLTILDALALIALQGPQAASVLARYAPDENVAAMPFMSARQACFGHRREYFAFRLYRRGRLRDFTLPHRPTPSRAGCWRSRK